MIRRRFSPLTLASALTTLAVVLTASTRAAGAAAGTAPVTPVKAALLEAPATAPAESAEFVKPESGKPAQAAEPVAAEPAGEEPAPAEPAEAEPAKAALAKSEPPKTTEAEPAESPPQPKAKTKANTAPAPAHAEHAEAAKPESAKPETTKSEAAKTKSPKSESEKTAATTKAESGKPEAAARSAARSQAGDELQSLLKLGASLTERGEYDAAEIAFRQVMNAHGAPAVDVRTALLGLARLHRKQGALTKAAAIYEVFIKKYGDDDRLPDALLELGRVQRDMGAPKAAIGRFYDVINATIKLSGDAFEHYQQLAKTAQYEIAETNLQTGNYADAAKFFARLRLLDLAPSDRARALFKAGYAQRMGGDLQGSVTTLKLYLEQCPDDENVPEARYLLAVNLRELKRPQEALTATLELLRTEKSRTAPDAKRWTYWQRRTGNQLANDFFESGDTLDAQAIYTGLVDLSPEPAWRLPLTYQIGLCYERLGLNERARESYKAVVEAAGATPPADLAELVRMAAWRTEHLAWSDKNSQQRNEFFSTAADSAAASAKGSPAPAPATDTTAAAAPSSPSPTVTLPPTPPPASP